mgnify:CR=1 FL=1
MERAGPAKGDQGASRVPSPSPHARAVLGQTAAAITRAAVRLASALGCRVVDEEGSSFVIDDFGPRRWVLSFERSNRLRGIDLFIAEELETAIGMTLRAGVIADIVVASGKQPLKCESARATLNGHEICPGE